MFNIKLADIVIGINIESKQIREFFSDYIVDNDENPSLYIDISDKEIAYEKEKSNTNARKIEYIKLAIYRKISEQLPYYDAFLIHGSAFYFDNCAYLLAGESGVGKSTHARLLREYYDAKMVNDDKPLIRFIENVPYIYGTPYNGKHHLSSNVKIPLNDIIFINQAKNNTITKISKSDSFTKLFIQTYKPSNKQSLSKTLDLINKLNNYVTTYELFCDISKQAADLTYTICKKN